MGVLQTLLSNGGWGINAKKRLNVGVIEPTALQGAVTGDM